MKVYLQGINKRYYGKFQKPDGKWTARALKGEGEEKATTSKVRAKLLLGDIAKQVEAEYAIPVETGQSDVRVQQLTSDFRKFNADNNSAGWASIQQLYIKRIIEFFGPDTLLKDITAKRIEEYASWRRNDVKGTTVNKELSTIRTMFDKAVDWEFIPSNPARKVKELPDDSAIHDRYLKPGRIRNPISQCRRAAGIRPACCRPSIHRLSRVHYRCGPHRPSANGASGAGVVRH